MYIYVYIHMYIYRPRYILYIKLNIYIEYILYMEFAYSVCTLENTAGRSSFWGAAVWWWLLSGAEAPPAPAPAWRDLWMGGGTPAPPAPLPSSPPWQGHSLIRGAAGPPRLWAGGAGRGSSTSPLPGPGGGCCHTWKQKINYQSFFRKGK